MGFRALILGLSEKINELSCNAGADFDPNEIGFYLAALKILDPNSQQDAFRHSPRFFYNKAGSAAPKDFCRTLEFFGSHKDEIASTLNRYVKERTGKGISLRYYDVTGCLFDVCTDEGWGSFTQRAPSMPCRMRQDLCLEGQAVICATAKAMLRLLQLRLKELGFNLRGDEIARTLRGASLTVIPYGKGNAVFAHVTKPTALCNPWDRKRNAKEGQERKLQPLEMNYAAMGFELLKAYNTLEDINRKLRIKANLKEAIGAAVYYSMFQECAPG